MHCFSGSRRRSAKMRPAARPGRRAVRTAGDVLRERREELGLDLDAGRRGAAHQAGLSRRARTGPARGAAGPDLCDRVSSGPTPIISASTASGSSTAIKAESAEMHARPDLSLPVPLGERSVPGGTILLVGLILALCGYGTWYYLSTGERSRPERVAAVPAELQLAPPQRQWTPARRPRRRAPAPDLRAARRRRRHGSVAARPIFRLVPQSSSARSLASRRSVRTLPPPQPASPRRLSSRRLRPSVPSPAPAATPSRRCRGTRQSAYRPHARAATARQSPTVCRGGTAGDGSTSGARRLLDPGARRRSVDRILAGAEDRRNLPGAARRPDPAHRQRRRAGDRGRRQAGATDRRRSARCAATSRSNRRRCSPAPRFTASRSRVPADVFFPSPKRSISRLELRQ